MIRQIIIKIVIDDVFFFIDSILSKWKSLTFEETIRFRIRRTICEQIWENMAKKNSSTGQDGWRNK